MRIIAGRWRGHTISAPPGDRTRPTTDRVRESWMSVLQHDLPGATVLDLFAGSGALGLEALSRGASHVTFVEKAAAPLRVLQANIDKLGAAGEVEVVRGDALKYIGSLEPFAFDIALADPPYDAGGAPRLMQAYDHTPFARILCIEHRVGDALPQEAAVEVETRRYGQTAITFITAPE